ncbi:MAG: type II toxin-antitoxin system Phd/YefM family antitoxin [Mobiluncus porci]|uniref:type II toxin-antitoxin system Phd/YefM family antitoxin n=1 Tax=Mobiluncus porci TaxID=2652278 RepID=UPI0023F0D362|nr:type II toxin-antitoxin system Phd/YefM family antitoxin [Mobiluncus porci]MDD7541867.1 type II toxin-antitoxin system Phd/YefM family antitoxin [Mobiluncus porci]MDY5749337.1 type II toxin-antitoxin system Phd/YefM family antitoxin [Mobiluncus porci]
MNVNTETLVPISEANQNFSKVTRLVDNYGTVIILKNNEPRYVIMEFNQADSLQEADDAEVARISKQLMERNKAVYAELAK